MGITSIRTKEKGSVNFGIYSVPVNMRALHNRNPTDRRPDLRPDKAQKFCSPKGAIHPEETQKLPI